MKTILQAESSECGLACLAMISSYYGHQVDLLELRRRFSISLKGATLAQIIRHASSLQMAARPLRLELEDLQKLRLPCILHWNLNHFVVLGKIKRSFSGNSQFIIFDPAIGEQKLPLKEISKYFTGVALELLPNIGFSKKEEPEKIAIRDLVGKISGIRPALFQIMALAMSLEIFSIISPLFNQFVIDEVIVSGDKDLLQILVIGFALVLITQTTIGLARSWFLMRWSIDIGFQWSIRVFTHLTKIPISFFEKRHIGDIVSRFSSIAAIQSTLTSLFIESALDGLMAILSLGMMLLYSKKLTILTIAGIILYASLRVLFYFPLKEAAKERLVLSSKESSVFLETIRAITPLKLFGRESERRAYWQNLKQDVINSIALHTSRYQPERIRKFVSIQ